VFLNAYYLLEIEMKKSELAIRAAFVGLVSVGFVTASQSALAAKGDNEKCYGIVKAGKNDCGGPSNSCAATSKTDADKGAWLYVPKGSCEKIVGGSLVTAMADTKMDKAAKK
jgi:uncharacterized membrane protein